MSGYGQFCPVAKASEILAERWTLLVLRELMSGSHHFNELRRGVPLMSPALLSKRLRTLEDHGLVERVSEEGGGVAYHLTRAGEELRPVIEMVGNWGHRWVRTRFTPEDLDPTLLMWDMRRTVQPSAFPGPRTVVQFWLVDMPSSKRCWWLVCEGDEVDLCMSNYGFDVDLQLRTDLATLTRIWLGDIGLVRAQREGLLEVRGSNTLRRCLGRWLRKSPFATVRPAR